MEEGSVARAIPQRGLPEIEEGALLGISVELIKGKWQYVFKYLAAEGKPFSDAVAGSRHG